MSRRPVLAEACELLGSPGLHHDRAQLALVAALTGSRPGPTEARLDDAARGLFGAAALSVREQAATLAALLTDRIGLQAVGGEYRALLIDEALARREAHPRLIALIGHELARRAGLRSFVGAIGARHWTVVHDGVDSALVGCELLETPPDPAAIRPRCAHEVAGAVLAELHRLGPPGWRPRVEVLRRALPVSGACGRGDQPKR